MRSSPTQESEAAHEDPHHRTLWHPAPDHPGRHAFCRVARTGVGRIQRGRARHDRDRRGRRVHLEALLQRVHFGRVLAVRAVAVDHADRHDLRFGRLPFCRHEHPGTII